MRLGFVVLILLTPFLAGCLAPDGLQAARLSEGTLVEDGSGNALPGAAATLLDADGTLLALVGADIGGRLVLSAWVDVASIVVSAPGHASWRGAPADLPATLTLVRLDEAALTPEDADPVLRFLTPKILGRAYLGDAEATCAFHNCGASEPSVEVAGDGTVYATGVCCVGKSPPIWVSRDGGATFSELEGDALRDNFGIEGDFAIDDAGNMYFSDISLASAYFSSWDKDGGHRWTMPAGPFAPLVDRPWVRADAEDHVVFAYNTGTSTRVYTSDDGARTWTERFEAPDNLGALGQGPERTHYWLTAGGVVYESVDAGETWKTVGPMPRPSESGGRYQAYEVPVVDEAGNLWVVYDWQDRTEVKCSGGGLLTTATCTPAPFHVYAARLDTSGAWHGPYRVSPEQGTHVHPWAAAGRDGTLAVAWYGAPDAQEGVVEAGDEWFVTMAVTLDGDSETPNWQVAHADETPVLKGPMDRRLLDFLQIDVGPDGALHLVYAKAEGAEKDEATWYVRTTQGLALAPKAFPNGPRG